MVSDIKLEPQNTVIKKTVKEKEQIHVENSHSVPGLELGVLHHYSLHPIADRYYCPQFIEKKV